MFTDLSFIEIGKNYPILDDEHSARLDEYKTGRLCYDGDIYTVFKDTWEKISTRFGLDITDIEQVMIAVNLFKPLTDTFKLLAFDQKPEISATKNDDKLKTFVSESKFIDVPLKRGFIGGHAQGEGIFKVYAADGKIKIASVNPEIWIPVYNPDDMDSYSAHVFAYSYKVNKGTFAGFTRYEEHLKLEINEKGKLTERTHLIRNGKIADIIGEEKITDYSKLYGWDDFLVFPFDYGRPNWKESGYSAYKDIIPLVEELIVRLSNNSKILDDHASPQIATSTENLEHNKTTNQWEYKRNQALIIGREGQMPQYLTWDGNLEPSEKHLDRIMNLFYMISGTNSQLYGQDIAGNLSGEALAKVFLIPIKKTKEMVEALGGAAQQALKCAMSLQGVKDIEPQITFNIGAFDTLEDISNRVLNELRSGGSSIERTVQKINPKYDVNEVKAEVDRIKEDSSVNAPDLNDLNNTGV